MYLTISFSEIPFFYGLKDTIHLEITNKKLTMPLILAAIENTIFTFLFWALKHSRHLQSTELEQYQNAMFTINCSSIPHPPFQESY